MALIGASSRRERIVLWIILSSLSLFCPVAFHQMKISSNEHSRDNILPVYWINLNSSTIRRDAMASSLAAVGAFGARRISACSATEASIMWHTGRLILNANVRLTEASEESIRAKHSNDIYHNEEAACLLSHLKAIKQAYDDERHLALIVEDDALISSTFVLKWRRYVELAPLGWKILQFATNNPTVMHHSGSLGDPFISWQPYHWSTRAYIINREGMQALVHNHFTSPEGLDTWRFDESPMVVADEVIYGIIGDAYTSTGLWVDSFHFTSTVQRGASTSGSVSSYSQSITSDQGQILSKFNVIHFEESLLILMSARIRDEAELVEGIQWIRQDNYSLCKLYRVCHWEINFVLTGVELLKTFEQLSVEMPSNVHFHLSIKSEAFNKFSFIRTALQWMNRYDLILLKDNDLRLSGFPWRTFIERRGNAVLAGPLRQTQKDAFQYRRNAEKQVWNQFHEAYQWVDVSREHTWSTNLFANVMPIEVPILEQSFVLFDSLFALFFFRQVLTPDFTNQVIDWGPDWLWCEAAKEWGKGRPGCFLVPVVSVHEDSHQIEKGKDYIEKGWKLAKLFGTVPLFHSWMKSSLKWNEVIGSLLLIDVKCRTLLQTSASVDYDLQSCIRALESN